MSFPRWFLTGLSVLSFVSVTHSVLPASMEKAAARPAETAADLSTHGTMKGHYHRGMEFYRKRLYDKAVPELIASTMIVDPFTWNYWYAEAYATLGIIYEFHRKEPDHLDIARQYYSLALKRDPHTQSAKYFLEKMGKGYSK